MGFFVLAAAQLTWLSNDVITAANACWTAENAEYYSQFTGFGAFQGCSGSVQSGISVAAAGFILLATCDYVLIVALGYQPRAYSSTTVPEGQPHGGGANYRLAFGAARTAKDSTDTEEIWEDVKMIATQMKEVAVDVAEGFSEMALDVQEGIVDIAEGISHTTHKAIDGSLVQLEKLVAGVFVSIVGAMVAAAWLGFTLTSKLRYEIARGLAAVVTPEAKTALGPPVPNVQHAALAAAAQMIKPAFTDTEMEVSAISPPLNSGWSTAVAAAEATPVNLLPDLHSAAAAATSKVCVTRSSSLSAPIASSPSAEPGVTTSTSLSASTRKPGTSAAMPMEVLGSDHELQHDADVNADSSGDDDSSSSDGTAGTRAKRVRRVSTAGMDDILAPDASNRTAVAAGKRQRGNEQPLAATEAKCNIEDQAALDMRVKKLRKQ
ncbi:hypothetical protein JKP88DRAFT_288416 [Tribonema minus]|uniref:Transmembrane protein n=1 Tax=Tribonema minus TaxID=303371 RepID=A0A836CHR0_9STRA|nr:hypothetical protein JKP88DRAFT_288416 [Tribonema minus]